MFRRLQQKWKVTPVQLVRILLVFALTGTTTAWISRQLPGWLPFSADGSVGLRWSLRLILLILGYPVVLLFFARLIGPFSFFRTFGAQQLQRLRLMKVSSSADSQPSPKRICLFASGAGSNARAIIEYFKDRTDVVVTLIAGNKPGAGVWEVAAQAGLPALLLERERWADDAYVPELKQQGIDLIVLAGFLWKVPAALINAFPHRIINIHPALLPKFGGKGMYGANVHNAVLAAGDAESGITIHYVDEQYDQGAVIFQARCPVHPNDTAADLARRIHGLEHQHFPAIIDAVLKTLPTQEAKPNN